MSSIFITNATQSAGPGIVRTLVAHHYHVICHDPSFTDKGQREDFAHNTMTYAIGAQSPEDIYKEVSSIGDVDRLVFHQPTPDAPVLSKRANLDSLKADFDALMALPFRLHQLFLPELKGWQQGSILFITSAQQLESGYAVSTDPLASTLDFISAMALEAEPFGIQVNALQAIFAGSELDSSQDTHGDNTAIGITNAEKTLTPGRKGTLEALGELVESFVSRGSLFKTGQKVQFTYR